MKATRRTKQRTTFAILPFKWFLWGDLHLAVLDTLTHSRPCLGNLYPDTQVQSWKNSSLIHFNPVNLQLRATNICAGKHVLCPSAPALVPSGQVGDYKGLFLWWTLKEPALTLTWSQHEPQITSTGSIQLRATLEALRALTHSDIHTQIYLLKYWEQNQFLWPI